MRMDRRIRHGKMISSYDEAVMDLMIKVEESERYLQKYRKSVGAVIVVENGEEEQYPSFSIKRKDKEAFLPCIPAAIPHRGRHS